MSFKLKNLTVKNFMSVGNQTQAVDFDKEHLTLVLGANIDLGGDDTGSRNGTGKTTIVNALSYAMYGQALTNIKKENLINKTNGKNMLVTVEFEKSGNKYKIERGRKPNVLKLYVNDQAVESKDEDESQGDSRETQKAIEQMLEMSHTMFKHLVALNTYTEPFLSMKAADQREVIEQLLGITQLSEKAEALKVLVKETKDKITSEEVKITAIKAANENVQKSIDSLQIKSNAWETKQQSELENLGRAIVNLESVDIESELALHVALKAWDEENTKIRNLNKQKATLESAVSQAQRTLNKYVKEIESLADKKCPACEQELHDHKHDEMLKTAEDNVLDAQKYFDKVNGDLEKIVAELLSLIHI
jgi:DNA repair exonuclease SbcCD ATPase subunit